jgi:hypothetical protein
MVFHDSRSSGSVEPQMLLVAMEQPVRLPVAVEAHRPEIEDGLSPGFRDGRHRSTVLPGLTLDPARLWTCLDDRQERRELEDRIVFVEPSGISVGPSTAINDRERWTWEWRAYTPPVGLKATPIGFEQFIDWCPEAKFELLEVLPHIGGWDGTRKVLGLLLMTFGLEETVQLLHPREWVAALLEEEAARRHDTARRDAW